jgi:hypothetical protein
MTVDKDPVILAAVEGGGTSFIVAVAELVENSTPKILHKLEIDSSHDKPFTTLAECAAFFEKHKPEKGYHSLGLATFGPVGLDKTKPTYGHILPTTPKQSWRNVDLLTPLEKACRGSRPIAIQVETDVNAPGMLLVLFLFSWTETSTSDLFLFLESPSRISFSEGKIIFSGIHNCWHR